MRKIEQDEDAIPGWDTPPTNAQLEAWAAEDAQRAKDWTEREDAAQDEPPDFPLEPSDAEIEDALRHPTPLTDEQQKELGF